MDQDPLPRRSRLPGAEPAPEAYPRKYKEVLRMRLAQVMCSILVLVLSPDFFGIMTAKRMSKAEQAQL